MVPNGRSARPCRNPVTPSYSCVNVCLEDDGVRFTRKALDLSPPILPGRAAPLPMPRTKLDKYMFEQRDRGRLPPEDMGHTQSPFGERLR